MNTIVIYISNLFHQLLTLDKDLIIFAALVVCAIIVLDAASIFVQKKNREIGLDPKTQPISIDGSKTLAVRTYVSDMQGIAGRPDALILEDGFIIPVERKPLANKIRDRYVAQLLVYMRLVEEFEGKRPPYGYLILGAKCRKFKIENSEKRQAWLQNMMDEMQRILAGAASVPTPHPKKCKRCDVRNSCNFKVESSPIVQIKKTLES